MKSATKMMLAMAALIAIAQTAKAQITYVSTDMAEILIREWDLTPVEGILKLQGCKFETEAPVFGQITIESFDNAAEKTIIDLDPMFPENSIVDVSGDYAFSGFNSGLLHSEEFVVTIELVSTNLVYYDRYMSTFGPEDSITHWRVNRVSVFDIPPFLMYE